MRRRRLAKPALRRHASRARTKLLVPAGYREPCRLTEQGSAAPWAGRAAQPPLLGQCRMPIIQRLLVAHRTREAGRSIAS